MDVDDTDYLSALDAAYMPTSYKIRQRLVNALIKLLLVLEKDLGTDLSTLRSKLMDDVNRYSLKNLKTAKDHTDGLATLALCVRLAVLKIEDLWVPIQLNCSHDTVLAAYAVHNKYYFIPGIGCQVWPRSKGEVPNFTDKQIIKAINCLRAKKDNIMA